MVVICVWLLFFVGWVCVVFMVDLFIVGGWWFGCVFDVGFGWLGLFWIGCVVVV